MTRLPHASPGSHCFRISLLSGLGLLWALLAVSQAQISLDGSLGPRGPLTGPRYRIGAELGQTRGSNLFHSFDQFNVPTGGSATFTGPTTIANIVGRVTGGQRSAIDGVLRSEIAGANLYLLNPSGVMFGPNARLDVSGSFHVSTADYLRLADGATFFATLGPESVLTVAEPAAFGFLGKTPGPITIDRSTLEVPRGKALSLISGDMTVMGTGLRKDADPPTLGAPGGRLQLVSVASPGEVVFSPLELAPDLRLDGFTQLGQLKLSQNARVDASGNGGGTVLLRGRRVEVAGSQILANTLGDIDGNRLGIDLLATEEAIFKPLGTDADARIQTGTKGAGRAGDIRLSGGHVQIDGSGNGAAEVGSTDPVKRETTGAGGDIIVQVRRLTLTGNGTISSASFNAGRAGDLTVIASDRISIVASPLFTNANASGAGGRLFVSAPMVRMDGRGQAPDGNLARLSARTVAGSRGDAGDIVLEVGRLELIEGARILSGTEGTGRGGRLTIVATEGVFLTGRGARFSSVIISGSEVAGSGTGTAGQIVIRTPTLQVHDGQILANTRGDGTGGDMVFEVGGLTLTGNTTISSASFGAGRAGDLTIRATEGVSIVAQARLFTNANASGAGGRLFVSAPVVRMDGRDDAEFPALLSTATISGGKAGDMVLEVGRLELINGAHISSSTRRTGGGGDIQIVARDIQLSSGSTIEASSTGDGAAGTIRIRASETFRSRKGRVTTAADRAGGGRIELQAGTVVQLADSQITTSVQGGGSDAGNLTLEAPFVVAEGSQISANAFGGMGGHIRIGSEVFLADPASRVSASSTLGIAGTVDIRAPVTTLSGTLAPLPQAFVNVAALLPARCAARFSEGKASSLVLGGRGSLPLEPGGVLPSPLVLEERLAADPALTGDPHQQTSAAKFALLAGQEKALPRLGCPK